MTPHRKIRREPRKRLIMPVRDTLSKELIRPRFFPDHDGTESPSIQHIIDALKLQKHVEGGYFAETDRDSFLIPNPFTNKSIDGQSPISAVSFKGLSSPFSRHSRAASTTIFYLLTPKSSLGAFHRNKGRTIHTLHRGRGRYVLIHADEVGEGQKARVETFIVGHNVSEGERLQWIVEGGKYKASFLLDDEEGLSGSEGLLISETVIPGFEYSDHNFMTQEQFDSLLTAAKRAELSWLLRKDTAPQLTNFINSSSTELNGCPR
ncbi:MAG: hypothetical protein M1812_005935 [Candelaria pacifica]|nr:MAG: hypothetical protein M1812_005935 [Candelaria pacifica]